MSKKYFITATGTGIGKSFITAALVRQAKALGRSVMAYKPVISGFDAAHVADSDTGVLLESLGLPFTEENIVRLSPWRFAAPLAPSMAARQEKRAVDFNELVKHGQHVLTGAEDFVLIEGVGGVMVPLTDHHTVLEWIEALKIPALLVTGSYLGSISHTLTALAALQQKQISVQAVILNESEASDVSLTKTADEIRRWTDRPVLIVRRQLSANRNENVENLWMQLGLMHN